MSGGLAMRRAACYEASANDAPGVTTDGLFQGCRDEDLKARLSADQGPCKAYFWYYLSQLDLKRVDLKSGRATAPS
jgi:hypothetical protein